MIRNLVNYVQAIRTATPGPWAGPLGVVAVGFGLTLLSKVAQHQRQQLALGAAELGDLHAAMAISRLRLGELRTAQDAVAKQLADIEAAVLANTYPTVYPAPEDLAPLAESVAE